MNNALKLTLLLAFMVLVLAVKSDAQQYSTEGGLCASDCSRVKRYNALEVPVYRHHEDVRRYNAAPNPKAYRGVRREGFPPNSRDRVIFPRNVQAFYTDGESGHPAVKLRTEVLRQHTEQVASYDARGCRALRCMTVTTYKDVFCDGRSRIWQHVGYSN